ncbi:MAG TPA: LD-carboxypeptidase [Chitinophagaceae bacterium]|jgi:muramoyltetrapeptide carboxypeptidase|nr:LD-carboxypeptidase [Chitinophagaceae bacterium]OPZ17176.1 MAG: putative murein peptide carboxypeptidase [Bacteroidetes bacterium ADurb.BinA245]HMW65709.1 LD-carboxypeptidase [Chitinophagaceae bacterium]HMX77046.1 LD-carboxypeptidase [Chitinophagaceae bacterium]HNA90892.1 LD-carboxypeptidase [Chitinophagaceae bacterium]
MITLPPYLKKGDTIGIVCPAGFMSREKMQSCIDTLKEWGYAVQLGSTTRSSSETYFSGTDEDRRADLQQMLDDNNIKAILCGRGGYGTGRIIDDLRFKQFVKKPKWIIGYSDITVLHAHIYSNLYISTLHSPMAAAFNDGGNMNEYVLSLKDALEGKSAFYQNPVTNFCRKGDEEGELVGGNLAMLAHMVGTGSDIKTKNRILFIEDVGEYQYNIDRMMHQLKRAGKLEKLNGLIFGIFSDTKDTERPFGTSLHEMLWEIIKEYDYPVCFDFPVSHSDKNYALKTGVRHRLKVGEKKITLEELS